MSDLYPVAGAKLYIGSAAIALPSADVTSSTFSSVTWTEIDGWETMGGFGDAAEVITTQLINRGRDVKQKGTRNAGSMENNFARMTDDAGQIALIAAEKTNDNYPFKIEWDDEPASGSAPTPTKHECLGLVTSANVTGGGANTIWMLSNTVEINTNILETIAATGD